MSIHLVTNKCQCNDFIDSVGRRETYGKILVFTFVLCEAPLTLAHSVNHLPLPEPGRITAGN